MPRPKEDYKLKDGTVVPGVSSLAKLADNPSGLIVAANKNGLKGIDTSVAWQLEADLGTEVHKMIEQLIRGEQVTCNLPSKELERGARLAFNAWQNWWPDSGFNILEMELSLVSHAERYGGTFDAILEKDGKKYVADWKTSSGWYPNMLTQATGYMGLVEENWPDTTIDGVLVVRLSKDAGLATVRRWSREQTNQIWPHFLKLRDVWEGQKTLTKIFKEYNNA